jgi:hypothetical protein
MFHLEGGGMRYICTRLHGMKIQKTVKVKVKQSRYRPGVAQRVPGS